MPNDKGRIDAARGEQEAGTGNQQPPHLSELPVLNVAEGYSSQEPVICLRQGLVKSRMKGNHALPVLAVRPGSLSKGFTSGFLTKNVRTGGSGGGEGNRPADHNWGVLARDFKSSAKLFL